MEQEAAVKLLTSDEILARVRRADPVLYANVMKVAYEFDPEAAEAGFYESRAEEGE